MRLEHLDYAVHLRDQIARYEKLIAKTERFVTIISGVDQFVISDPNVVKLIQDHLSVEIKNLKERLEGLGVIVS